MQQISMAAASLSLPKHPLLSSLLPFQSSTKPSSSFSQTFSKSSQFHGLKLSHSSSLSSPSTSFSTKTSIFAKVEKGTAPPPFQLKDQNGRLVSLSKYRNKPVVVYFYPADESPGCTKQACSFRDSYENFKKAGAEVIGISGDDPESHKEFAKKYRLPYVLLSDEGDEVRKEWGVPSDLFVFEPLLSLTLLVMGFFFSLK
ncbi:hypothetical protein ACET3Z_012098 [Daucus carota]